MAIYLDEDMIGTDANMIAFPHLLLCMGVVVVMQDGSLIGAHFTTPQTEQSLLHGMRRTILGNGSGMDQLYCMANLAEHIHKFGGLDINGKAEALGFAGQGYVADFGVFKPTDGTYAQVTTNGAGHRATVRCKLNEHMVYAYGAGVHVLKAFNKSTTLATGESFSRNRLAAASTHTLGAASPDLNTPFLKPVTIS